MAMRSGYAVTIKGFIPTDPNDLEGHAAMLAAVRAAKAIAAGEEGVSADPMFKVMNIETFEVKAVSRRAETKE